MSVGTVVIKYEQLLNLLRLFKNDPIKLEKYIFDDKCDVNGRFSVEQMSTPQSHDFAFYDAPLLNMCFKLPDFMTVGGIKLLENLLNCGADPNSRGQMKNTCLAEFFYSLDSYDCIELPFRILLSAGANPNLYGYSLQNTLEMCLGIRGEQNTCARILIEADAVINARSLRCFVGNINMGFKRCIDEMCIFDMLVEGF